MAFKKFNEWNKLYESDQLNEKIVPVSIDGNKIGEVDDRDKLVFNKVVSDIKNTLSAVELESFLPTYLEDKQLTGSELEFAKNKIIAAYNKSGGIFSTEILVETLKNKQIPIKSLISSSNFIKDISTSYGGIPEQFIIEIFKIDGKPGSASIGKGEFMLLLFTDLLSAASKDLEDSSGNTYEVKDNGEKNGGFRVGSQGKPASNAIRILNDSSISFNYDDSLPFNVTSSGGGIPLAELIGKSPKEIKEIDLKTFAKAFLTFEKAYDKSIDSVTKSVLQTNDLNLFRSYLGSLQMWGYMKAEKIENVVVFDRKRGVPKNIGLYEYESNFSKFFSSNREDISVTGWENDGRNTSFRIKYTP